jgi:alkanesulfonate monooxygenase SsuD/methylene tetrahydromethanopterin reductase-like flavin-dependent oxidoreductase (luciferase family)
VGNRGRRYPFDHRFERFEETLRIIAPLVRGDTVTFDGTYHRADEAVLMPERMTPELPSIGQSRQLASVLGPSSRAEPGEGVASLALTQSSYPATI